MGEGGGNGGRGRSGTVEGERKGFDAGGRERDGGWRRGKYGMGFRGRCNAIRETWRGIGVQGRGAWRGTSRGQGAGGQGVRANRRGWGCGGALGGRWEVFGIPIVFRWSSSISSNSFLPSVLLWLVIIIAVVGVGVTVVVVVAGIVVVVESSSVVKLSFVMAVKHCLQCSGIVPDESLPRVGRTMFGTMFGNRTINSWNLLTLGICIPPGQGIVSQVGPVFLLGLLVFAIVAAYASRAAVTMSATSFLLAA
ncbi:hypothetical protein Tco_0835185 [Tanacetum coccineum]